MAAELRADPVASGEPLAAPGGSVLPLRVRGLNFEAGGQRLLADIGFEVHAGDRLVVLGPNGAGKSLLLRLCHGLLAPTAGTVRWAQPAAAAARAQAFVFQRPVLLRRSARANIEYALRLAGVPAAQRAARSQAALDQTGLAHLAARAARVLSGGEQQRLTLARAAALRPQLLWLDEPTAHLDPGATGEIERMVHALHAAGTTVVMTTHDLAQARRLATRVLFLARGILHDDQDAAAFFERPGSLTARRFLAGELLA